MANFKKLMLGTFACLMTVATAFGFASCDDGETVGAGDSFLAPEIQSDGTPDSIIEEVEYESTVDEQFTYEARYAYDPYYVSYITHYAVTGIDFDYYEDEDYDEIINIPSTYNGYDVKEIANDAFDNLDGVETINISSKITKIGARAFYQCSDLKSITIPSNVTEIEHSAFYDCDSLETVTINASATEIPSECFSECKNLMTVNLNSTITHIGSNAFRYCRKLLNINMPSGLVSIGSNAFANTALNNAWAIPDTLETIGSYAFANTGLKLYTTKDVREAGWHSSIEVELATTPSHIHTWTVTSSVASTCEEEGSLIYNCTCGEFVKMTFDELGHTYDKGVCVNCNEYGRYVIYVVDQFGNPVKNASVSLEYGGSAQTNEKGMAVVAGSEEKQRIYAECSYGDYDYDNHNEVYTPEKYGTASITLYHEHNYSIFDEDASYDATCTSTGMERRACVCGLYEDEVIEVDSDAHEYDEYNYDGEYDYTCNLCGEYRAYEVHVKDQFGKPVVGVRVTIDNDYDTTDKDGIAIVWPSFEGRYVIQMSRYDTQSYAYQTEVKATLEYGIVEVEMFHWHHYNYDSSVVTYPTCVATGVRNNYCVCGDFQPETIPVDTVGGHDFANGPCRHCGSYSAYVINVKDQYNRALEDVYVNINGYTAYTNENGQAIVYASEGIYNIYLSDYNTTYYTYNTVQTTQRYSVITIILNHTHNYNYDYELVTPATCSSSGTEKHICICGDYTSNSIDPIGHYGIVEVPSIGYSYSCNGSYGFSYNNGVFTSTNGGYNGTTSYVTVTITVAGTYTIGYYVSSESNYDELYVEVDSEVIANNISGEYDWYYVERDLDVGDIIYAAYSKDGSQERGEDVGKISVDRQDAGTFMIPLYTIENDSVNPFEYIVDNSSGSTVSTFVSTNHGNNSSASLTVTVNTNTTIDLTYAVSSESDHDYLYIYINDNREEVISGEYEYTTSIDVNAGDVITITYSKDDSINEGDDCATISLSSPCFVSTDVYEDCIFH